MDSETVFRRSGQEEISYEFAGAVEDRRIVILTLVGRIQNDGRETMAASGTTVLHVCESFAGGLGAAIKDYVRNTPNFTHHLLYASRLVPALAGPDLTEFETVSRLPSGHLNRVAAVRRTVRQLSPSIVHAHSSFAGAYVRLAVRASSAHRIVYTPHCYAFERRDVSRTVRAGFRLAEWILSVNTTAFAACSYREAALSRWPLSPARVVSVPNVVSIDFVPTNEKIADGSGRLILAGAGRLNPQKDPRFFIAAVSALQLQGVRVRPVWIGGGDDDLQAEMESLGIRVTGWLDRREALKELSQADLYLHTAAWEGFPIAVLEASALAVATIIRRIPAFDELAVPASITRPEELANRWHEFASDSLRADLIVSMRAALANFDDESQHRALLQAWDAPESGES